MSIPATEMHVCPHCGAHFDRLPNFCPECGMQLSDAVSEATALGQSANENAPDDELGDAPHRAFEPMSRAVPLSVRSTPADDLTFSERLVEYVRSDPIAVAAIAGVLLLAVLGLPLLFAKSDPTPSGPVQLYVASENAIVRTDASPSATMVIALAHGQPVRGELQPAEEGSSQWFKIEEGPLAGDFISASDLAESPPAPAPTAAPASAPTVPPASSAPAPAAPVATVPAPTPPAAAPPVASPAPATAAENPPARVTHRSRHAASHASQKHSRARNRHRAAAPVAPAPVASPAPAAEPDVSCVMPGGQVAPMSRAQCRGVSGVVLQN